ncbi:PDC sensor domain-containing protein [Desulfospira joergensenii]|uniref:PDC sensor domain-containing protein n=1 Tax=Desulfospira joergensenii TaxID=53329 RepID=UPI0003B71601|nr:PDC sensor domain-containing protein [Desulfospira joergensenii]
MKKFWITLISVIWIFGFTMGVWAEKAPQKIVDLANTELAKYGTSPEIVKAVKAENAKGKTLDDIKKTDEKWKAFSGIADYMKALMDSECGKFLIGVLESKPFFAEIFVMDNQGANVAMTDKTSDYWQGDEAKFKKSFNGGKGDIFVDEVEFDDSAQAYLVQVSVPVKDADQVIGAITFGIDVDLVD